LSANITLAGQVKLANQCWVTSLFAKWHRMQELACMLWDLLAERLTSGRFSLMQYR